MQDGQAAGRTSSHRSASFIAQTLKDVRSDVWFYVAAAAYFTAAWILAASLDALHLLKPFLYIEPWLNRLSFVTFLALPVWVIAATIWRSPLTPLTGLPATLRRLFATRLVAGVLMVVGMAVFYGIFTSIKNMLPLLGPFSWDVWLADLDRALHGGVDPGVFLQRALGGDLTDFIDVLYGLLWFMVFQGVTAWAAFSRAYAHLRRRFFITFVLCWVMLGNVLAGVFLSAGPCFYAAVTGDRERFSELVASVSGSAATYQPYLWKLYASGDVSLGSGISAFPSMHLAMATLVAIYLWSVSRRLGVCGIVFVILIQIGSVRLAWHYAVDGYASILITLLLWQTAGWICRLSDFRLRGLQSSAATVNLPA